MSLLRRVLCRSLGGHAYGWPRLLEGRMRQRCLYDCGSMTRGWDVKPKPTKVLPFLNLTVKRSGKRRVA